MAGVATRKSSRTKNRRVGTRWPICSARAGDHLYRPIRAQGNRGLHRNILSRNQFEFPLLSHCRQDQRGFRPGKAFADTRSGSGAERQVAEFVPRGARFGRPAFWIEAKGIGEMTPVVVHNPLAGGDEGAARNLIRAEQMAFDSAASSDSRRRIRKTPAGI